MRYEDLAETFREVEKAFSRQQAVTEANRCIKCQNAPCAKGCPAEVDIAKFIRQIATRNFRGAIKVIKEDNVLAGICGRICPQSIFCEKQCSSSDLAEPIEIGMLQRFAADEEWRQGPKPLKSLAPKGLQAAVVGSGPAGLSAAAFLKRLGYEVDIFEAEKHPGGILTYGIPPYRLPKDIVRQEIHFIQSLGVNLHTEKPVKNLNELLERYRAVFLGAGCSRPHRLRIPGEELPGVAQALDLLREVNLSLIEKRDCTLSLGDEILVIGGGNAAMDAAVTARKLGARQVTVLYRRSEEEMPAWQEEREFALGQGVVLQTLVAPTRFIAKDGRLAAVDCQRMRLGEPDASGRRRPIPLEDSAFRITCSAAVVAVGQGPPAGWDDLERNQEGLVKVESGTLAASLPGVYAGGDLIRGTGTAVEAVADGKRAALAMDSRLQASR
jgi:glutamate synthase (NADPH/NADH) small chain